VLLPSFSIITVKGRADVVKIASLPCLVQVLDNTKLISKECIQQIPKFKLLN